MNVSKNRIRLSKSTGIDAETIDSSNVTKKINDKIKEKK